MDGTVEYSPRRQGAGEVNVADSINTNVYLESLVVKQDGTFTKTGLKKSKIELKNNDLIKEGKINLSFLAHSTSNVDKTYDAKIKVMKPRIEEYYNYENHKEDNKIGDDVILYIKNPRELEFPWWHSRNESDEEP